MVVVVVVGCGGGGIGGGDGGGIGGGGIGGGGDGGGGGVRLHLLIGTVATGII